MSLNKISINDTTTVNTGIVYDISKAHNGTTYTDLTDALGTNGINVPLEVREGGMSVKFIQTGDNKYVQYRLISTSFSTNEADWQGSAIIDTDRIADGAVTTEKLSNEVRLHSTDEPMLNISDLISLPSQCTTVSQNSTAFILIFYTISGKIRLVGTGTSMSLWVCIRCNDTSLDVVKSLDYYEGDFDVTIDLSKELNIYPTKDFKHIEVAINTTTDCTVNEAYATSDIMSDIIRQKKYNIYKTYNILDFNIKNQLVYPNGELGSYNPRFGATPLLEIPEECVFISVKDVYHKQYYDAERTQYAFGGISLFDVNKIFIATVLEPGETLVDLSKYSEARYIQASYESLENITNIPTNANPEINFLTDSLVTKLMSDNKDLVDKMAMTLSYRDAGVYGWNDNTTTWDWSNPPETIVTTVKNSATDISGIVKSITVTCANSGSLRFCVGFLDQRSRMIPSQYFEIEAKKGYYAYNVLDKTISISKGQQLFVYPHALDAMHSVLGFRNGNKEDNPEHEMLYGSDTGELEKHPVQYGGFICLEYTVVSINSFFFV